MNLEVNDLVYVSAPNNNFYGKIGRVASILDLRHIGVRFFDPIPGGSDLGGLCPKPYGHYFTYGQISKMNLLSSVLKHQWVSEWLPIINKKDKKESDLVILIEEK